eukprot:gene17360-23977_t
MEIMMDGISSSSSLSLSSEDKKVEKVTSHGMVDFESSKNWLEDFLFLNEHNISDAIRNGSLSDFRIHSGLLFEDFLNDLLHPNETSHNKSNNNNISFDEILFKNNNSDKLVDYKDNSYTGISNISHKSWEYESCPIAASYYFPVTQYVASHFGMAETGVGQVEDISLYISGKSNFGYNFIGHKGELDPLHIETEADAALGDANAQVWLAKKYYWGFGGVPRDETLAKYWFQQAANQNNPEGLYNIGAFYAEGRAGVKQNRTIALDYFMKAINTSKPFAMAFHSIGNHYLHFSEPRNESLARYYLLRAVELNSPEGMFSLAMLHREGIGGQVSIPYCLFFLSLGASRGHVRSINFLAHALFDQESWLAHYGKENIFEKQNLLILDSLFPNHNASHTNDNSLPRVNKFNHINLRNKKRNISEEFDGKSPIEFLLPNGNLIKLPFPYGSLEGSCESALFLMKFLSDMNYRAKDTVRMALESYLIGDYWKALELYDEAAELGIQSSIENSAYLYEKMKVEVCNSIYYAKVKNNSDDMNAGYGMFGQPPVDFYIFLDSEYANETAGMFQCQLYFERMAFKRWKQLSKMGHIMAMRKLADRYMEEWNETSVLSAIGIRRNVTRAFLLYSTAAEYGDVESIMKLGWIMHGGDE